MAPTFRIHRPDVLASLPRPLDHTKGQYHIGEVYTQKAGSKKRKRLEVVVGVDGEAANIYHIPSSGLRTSYPIPPQESFTCAPHSIRYQDASANGRNNYTYLSTQDTTGAKITLCRDVVDATGKTNSSSTSQRVRHKSPITYLFTSTAVDATGTEMNKDQKGDVIGLCKDGQVVCLGAEDLEQRWSASSYNLCKDLLPSTVAKYEVEFALHAPTASEVLNGVFQGRQDAFGSFGRQVDPKTFNPDVLTIVVRAKSENTTSRFLIVLGVLPTVSSQPLVQIHTTPLPSQEETLANTASYQLHVQSGKLLQLSGPVLRTYDLTSAVPKLQGRLPLAENTSFLQISEHSILSLSSKTASILNPTFYSIQASTKVELPEGHDQAPRLVTFLSKLDMAVSVVGNTLVSIQIERSKSHGKEGLLIDSIGRGLPRGDRVPASLPKGSGNNTFEQYLPGTLSDAYVKESLTDVEKADGFLLAQDWKAFESLLAQRFGVAIDESAVLDGVQTPDWKWLERSETYPAVDRRWVLYAISRVFTVDTSGPEPVLRCVLPASNVLIYLISAGHLTNANMTAAFKGEIAEGAQEPVVDKLIQRLADMDPMMELLMNYVSSTKLGERELLLVIRIIMRSLDQQSRLLLPAPKETKEEDYVEMEIDHLEKELELAECHLGDDSNLRARTLTTAFEKLANYSSVATVRALRETFNPTEILSLIHLLRVQLIGSAWTSRYVDTTNFDRDDASRAPPDGAISLIAELLSRCIDSVGPSGWLTNGFSGDQADAADFITALKLEVSAALEGLEEAVTLGAFVGDAVQYGSTAAPAAKSSSAARGQQKPVSLEVEISPRLPLGLVSKQAVANHKIVSGGEVLERTSRERGLLLSQKVKAYSLERITI
ncbi:hypothetical protein RB213_007665 [Colletotrichum asianum]